MRGLSLIVSALVALSFLSSGCSTAPKSEEDRVKLEKEATEALANMKLKDPSLDGFLKSCYGYAVFPSIGKGGIIIGGAYGRGTVYEGGRMVGWADMTQASFGAQLGGQTFKELLCFQNKETMDKFKAGKTTFDATLSAVILKSGAATSAKWSNGVAVFTDPNAGAMFEASVSGQGFEYKAK